MSGRLDLPQPRDGEEGVDLQQRDGGSGDELRAQEIPARQRADEQRAHIAHLAIVDHRERRLHAVEELDHRHQARRDIHLIKDIDVVRGNDRDAEDLPKADGENEQPYQGAYQGRDESLALMQETQGFPPHDAIQADGILSQRKARSRRRREDVGTHAGFSGGPVTLLSVNRAKAEPMSFARAAAITSCTGP